ncbi:Aspartic proteinase-like protein 2 [Sesamum alatum]|uniref:Aspartic proteinase-like protein 2 n=1 Tax=Sesamum alatum TaxID=300844 RepID=A0AAE1Z1M8_9LAMI|nr:Aspartic proteinase-like protein 2 [Sesamum alatum]
MPPAMTLLVQVFAAALLLTVAVGDGGKSLVLSLERTSHAGFGLSQLSNIDRVRHGRLLQQQPAGAGVVNLPLLGTYDPFLVGRYFTRIKLGTPPKQYYVLIDTGSHVLWVSCKNCKGCPTYSGLQIELQLFDPSNSSTASVVSCSDRPCALGSRSSDAACADSRCGYKFRYADGSGTSGYYVSDSVYLDTILGNPSTSNASAPIIFGCSTSHSGDLIRTDNAVDGILGLGRTGISLISQLSARGITRSAFAHCLRGENGGGGVLVLGQTEVPNMVYTPLVPSQSLYHVNLQSIAVDGQNLNIDPSVFATSNERGTILDSGTTLAFLAEEAFDPFVKTITQAAVSKSAHALFSRGSHCYQTNSSETFPLVHLNFAGGVSMTLKPQDYLLQQRAFDGSTLWCIGFQNNGKMTILGDLVLKDRMVVYDLEGQRIGWADYNCSLPVNFSNTSTTTAATDAVRNKADEAFPEGGGRADNKNSAHYGAYKLTLSNTFAFVLYSLVFFHFCRY